MALLFSFRRPEDGVSRAGRSRFWAVLLGLMLAVGGLSSCTAGNGDGGTLRDRIKERRAAKRGGETPTDLSQETLSVNGVSRTYYLHMPRDNAGGRIPLVFVFHGGRGNGPGVAATTGFNAVADRNGFAVAYPESPGNWRDGRSTTGSDDDDIRFVRAMIADLSANRNIDTRRVYSTGISNGGIFTLRLACDMSNEIAAFAPVAASLAAPYEPQCRPSRPVPMLLIHGSNDEWVRWEGGEVRSGLRSGAGGYVIPVPDTVEFWRTKNRCSTGGPSREWRDPDSNDGTRVEILSYAGCADSSALVLMRIEGGGHTWPGSPKEPGRMAKRLVGNTSRDITGSDVIWNFFERHRLP